MSKQLQKNKDGAIVLCCGGKGCPTLKKDNGMVKITDDLGNTIQITTGEAKLIAQAIKLDGE